MLTKEAKITLPMFDNDGNSLQSIHDELIRKIIAFFGGVTKTNGEGVWIDKGGNIIAEPVTVYTFAAQLQQLGEDRPVNSRSVIRTMAKALLVSAKQQAIYVAYPEGDTEIVEG